MANEPIYNVASFDHKNKLCSAQTVVETRILPMGGVTISKVLSYSADGMVDTTDVFTGEVRVAGKITFRVLFLDGEGNCRTGETMAEFTDKIANDAISGAKPTVISRILDTDITNLANDEIKLAAIVEMDLYDNVSTRVKYLQTVSDDVYATEQQAEYCKLAAVSRETLSLSNEISVEGDKILLSESKIITLSRSAGMDNVIIGGEIISNIVTEKEGNIYSYRLVTPFNQECAAEGCKSGCFVDSSAKLNKAAAVLMLDENSAAVALEFEADLTAHVYTEEIITPITDAFSITNELSLMCEEINIHKNRVCKTVSERVEGSVTLDNDMPIADKILAHAGSKLNLANAYTTNGKLVLEGTLTASIIYFSAETKAKTSVAVELPFSITTPENISGKIIAALGEINEITAKIRRGNEIDIKAEIAVSVSTVESDSVRVITDLSVGEKMEIPTAAVSLHIARPKETLWDVAKALKTTPELILVQNPDLNLPLSGGERVIVYRHLKNSK